MVRILFSYAPTAQDLDEDCEATEQETRLIKSGKFKDIQRANIKLAVKFILENVRVFF
jgi:hypothetical protein